MILFQKKSVKQIYFFLTLFFFIGILAYYFIVTIVAPNPYSLNEAS